MTLSLHAKRILLPVHAVAAAVIGIWALTGAHWNVRATILAVLWWTLLSGVGIAVGFHRYLSHHAFTAKPWAAKLMLWAGSLAGQGSPIFWVALHIGYHHPKSDQAGDVHSPVFGIWSSYMGWMFKLKPTDVELKYAVRLMRDEGARNIHKNYNSWFWKCYAAILWVAFVIAGPAGLVAVMCALLLAIHQECLVNVLSHSRWAGYQSYDVGDRSVNNPVLGLFTWGQAIHNNHHRFPRAWNFGVRWYEFDPCRLLVPLLRTKA